MEMSSVIGAEGKLTAVVIRADGTREYLGELLPTFWQKARRWVLDARKLFHLGFVLAVLGALLGAPGLPLFTLGLVTTAGVNYMASDFASGGATPTISGMKYHACGTGTTAAAIGDTALQTDSGVARVIGTPSNPSANIYKSIGTMAFVSSLAITEWGLFSALTVGTLWDHRVFSAINVNSGDSIQFTYQLTIAAGGS
jgi:hypothetical protein